MTPRAAAADHDPQVVGQLLQRMGDRRWLGLKVDPSWGGLGFNDGDYGRVQMILSRHSGALAFVQTQHQSAAIRIARGDNDALKHQLLPAMARGELLGGVAISHLRRQDAPPLTATPVAGGYVIRGSIPWITGYGLFQQFLVGARLPGDRALLAMMPFGTVPEKITLSPPLPLGAMAASGTVTAQIHDWFLPQEQVVKICPVAAVFPRHPQKLLHHGFFALGCAGAAIATMEETLHRKGYEPSLGPSVAQLSQALTNLETAFFQSVTHPQLTTSQAIKLRGQGIQLMHQCSLGAIAIHSGAANIQGNAAQRIYGEALVFTVAGQNFEVMRSTLEEITTNFSDLNLTG